MSLFHPPHQSTEDQSFRPPVTVAEHLGDMAFVAAEKRHSLPKEVLALLALTDKMALRAAETVGK